MATTLACSHTSAPNTTLRPRAARSAATPTLTPQQSGTTNRLQAISAVDDQVAWARGVGGTYAVTTDSGTTWRSCVVPGASILEFRDVEAQSDKVAYLLAAGPGEFSRIYKTRDGGVSWQLGAGTPFPGSVYGLSYVKGMGRTVVATGPGGAAWSSNEGNSWTDLPGNLDYWAVTFASPTAGWMVGTGGRIVKISF